RVTACSPAAPKFRPVAHSRRLAPLATVPSRSTIAVARAEAPFLQRHSPARSRVFGSRAPHPSPYGKQKHILRAIAAKEPLQALLAFEATRWPSCRGRAKEKMLRAILGFRVEPCCLRIALHTK